MLNSFRTKRSSVLVWLLMVLLIVGLAGFGISVGGGLATREVARVGDREVSADEYARMVDQEVRAISQQLGQPLSMADARSYGIDRMALLRLVNDTALDGEAAQLGLSVGDDAVREQILRIPAFQGSSGFDRAAYAAALERVSLSPAEFEEQLRADIARSLLLTSVSSVARMPAAATDALIAYIGERRSFAWLALGEETLAEPLPAPDDAALAAFHDAHSDRYMRPETSRVSYAIAAPEQIAEGIEIPEAELRAAYEAGKGQFTTPERRLLERIGFRTEDEAAAAKARIDAGEASFEDIAAERGLTPEDTDLGMVEANRLTPDARAAVFGAAEPGIVGPVSASLGPSLYRINAIFAAEVTPFEQVRDELRRDRALEAANVEIRNDLTNIEDLIAGGATLEEITASSIMTLGSLDYSTEATGPIAEDPAFVTALADAGEGVESDLVELSDGSYLSFRLERIDPPAVIPLDEIRDRVAADWRNDRLLAALRKEAAALKTEISAGLGLQALADRLGIRLQTAGPLSRNDTVDGTPPRLLADVFAAQDGDVLTVEDSDRLLLARVTGIVEHDAGQGQLAAVRQSIAAQFDAQVAEDLRATYTTALRDEAGVRLNQSAIDATLDQYQ